MSITATCKKSQRDQIVRYLKSHPKGITSLEAAIHLGITCLPKRMGEIDGSWEYSAKRQDCQQIRITKTWEKPKGESKRIRYKLAR